MTLGSNSTLRGPVSLGCDRHGCFFFNFPFLMPPLGDTGQTQSLLSVSASCYYSVFFLRTLRPWRPPFGYLNASSHPLSLELL